MLGPRHVTIAVVLPLALACAPTAPACDAGSCPLLTQSQDGVRTKGSFGVDVSFRSMDYGRYVGRPGSASALVDFENGRLVGNHHRDASMDHDLLQVDVSYGLSARLTLVGALPLMNRLSHGHYDYRPVDSEGIVHEHGPIPPQWVLSTDEIVHNENGLGDVQLGATYAVLWSTTLSLVPGVRVRVTSRSVLYSYVKIPIAASTGGAPLAPTLDVAIGVGTRF